MAELMNERAIRIMVYGDGKVGKTYFAATGPKPCLFLDVEKKARYLPGAKVRWNPLTQEIPEYDGSWDFAVVSVDSYAKLKAAVDYINENPHPFLSVVVDSLTELQQLAMDEVVGDNPMKIQDWGTILRMMNKLITQNLLTMVEHETYPLQSIVGIAQAVHLNQGTADEKTLPSFQGGYKDKASYAWDISSYLYNDQLLDEETGEYRKARLLLTGNRDNFDTGVNVPEDSIPEIIENPNVSEILDAVFGPETDV